jgi:uncharacterized metal-binding protein YceD (DUF177 family)
MNGGFSVVVPLARLGARPQTHALIADAAARASLAARFDLEALDRLEGTLELRRTAAGAQVTGRMVADVVQRCVVSGEPVPAHLDEALDLRFEPSAHSEDELELEPDALDTLPLEGDGIDLGEALAQALAVALEPYPRAAPEVLARVRRHLLSEEEAEAQAEAAKATANPFSALRRP